jgi:hypothetical protein
VGGGREGNVRCFHSIADPDLTLTWRRAGRGMEVSVEVQISGVAFFHSIADPDLTLIWRRAGRGMEVSVEVQISARKGTYRCC